MREIVVRPAMILAAVLLFGSATVLFGQVRVEPIKEKNVFEGCGCSLKAATASKNSRQWLFLSELGSNEAWMNIDGRGTKLILANSTQNPDRPERVGDRFVEEYTAPGIKVRLVYVTTRTCPPLDESCEVISYNATITVTKGRSNKMLKVKGECGC